MTRVTKFATLSCRCRIAGYDSNPPSRVVVGADSAGQDRSIRAGPSEEDAQDVVAHSHPVILFANDAIVTLDSVAVIIGEYVRKIEEILCRLRTYRPSALAALPVNPYPSELAEHAHVAGAASMQEPTLEGVPASQPANSIVNAASSVASETLLAASSTMTATSTVNDEEMHEVEDHDPPTMQSAIVDTSS